MYIIYSVSIFCSIVANFPAKRLTNTALKIRMRHFFFFLPINWALIYLLSLIISISEEVKKQSFIVCIVFQQYLLNKPQKFRVPQSILFASN